MRDETALCGPNRRHTRGISPKSFSSGKSIGVSFSILSQAGQINDKILEKQLASLNPYLSSEGSA